MDTSLNIPALEDNGSSSVRRCLSSDNIDRPISTCSFFHPENDPSAPEMSACDDLPDELLHSIFSRLDPLSIVNAAATCKRWRTIIASSQSLQRSKAKEFNLNDDSDDDFESMSVDADSEEENDLAMPTRYQRLACVQRWIEGSWPSIEERSLEKPAEERNVGRGLKADAGGTNWFTPYAFRHPTSLSAKEWGKILDTQLCR